MKTSLLTICAVLILATGCTKTVTNPNIACTCRTTVKASQGFTKDTVLVNTNIWPSGTITTAEAKTECNGNLFWPSGGVTHDTFYISRTNVGNGYIPGSSIVCNL